MELIFLLPHVLEVAILKVVPFLASSVLFVDQVYLFFEDAVHEHTLWLLADLSSRIILSRLPLFHALRFVMLDEFVLVDRKLLRYLVKHDLPGGQPDVDDGYLRLLTA